jgi:multiple sugar transport system ATP-binding protein
VLWQERLGESTSLYLDSGVAGVPWIVKAAGNAHAAPGQHIAFGLPDAALHLFDDQGLALKRCVPDGDVALPLAA